MVRRFVPKVDFSLSVPMNRHTTDGQINLHQDLCFKIPKSYSSINTINVKFGVIIILLVFTFMAVGKEM